MTFRKRRQPTPDFKLPPPFQPITGERAALREDGIYPYCAMVQIAEDDIYRDYVVCRGFETRLRKFVDYEAGNADKPGLSVAKPFGKRLIGTYEVAQVFPAMLPVQGTEDYTPPSPIAVDWRVGQNPGTADNESGGHPEALTDTISKLVDHNGRYVNWILLDAAGGGGATIVMFSIDSFDDESGIAICTPLYVTCGTGLPGVDEYTGKIEVTDPAGCNFNEPPEELIDRIGWAAWMISLVSEDYGAACEWVCTGLCCPPTEPLAE